MADATDLFNTLVADLDYPMFVVTTAANGQRAGCLVGFATQASIDPPRLIVLLSKSNCTFRVARHAKVLVVNVLHDGNTDLAALFGEQTGDNVDKFALCDWEEGPEGAPLLTDARGSVAGAIVARLDAGDHVAHLMAVQEVARRHAARRFLPFSRVKDLTPGHPA